MSNREWMFYISDMLKFSHNVLTYSGGMEQEEFERSGLNYDATIRNLELIGEAARHIPPEIRGNYAGIPWRQLVATRNQLIHGYLGIDNDILWDIIEADIPALVLALEKVEKDLKAKE